MAPYRKLLAAFIGGALTLGSRWFPGLEDVDVQAVTQAILLLLTAFGVYQLPNAPEKKS